jgi:D-alanyl-D-alanine carboxypeptidase (penicillin-binding protein 5/6)
VTRHPVRLAAATLAVLAVAPASAHAQAPRITGTSAIVLEPTTGDVAYAKAPDARRPIASTTKLMTALLVLENAELTDTFTAPRYRGLATESKINLRAGERLTVADLLRALLVYSANDAAETLAQGVAGSRGSFVRQMNRRAVQLGLTNTHYANPIGLDEAGNYSSARDLAKLTLALRRFAFFRETVDSRQVTLHSGARVRHLSNRNLLVQREDWVDGVKTGHTQQAGYVLVASGSRNGIPLISVVLGTPSELARDTDSLKLLAYGKTKFKRTLAVRRDQVAARVPIKYRPGAELNLLAVRSVRRVVRKGKGEHFERVPRGVPDEVEGPVHRGDRIGKLDIVLHGRRITSVTLVAASDVEAAGFARRAQDAVLGPWAIAVLGILLAGGALLARLREPERTPRRPRPAPGEPEAT